MGFFGLFKKDPEPTGKAHDPLNILSVTKASPALPKVIQDYESGGGRTSSTANQKIYSSSDLVNSAVNYIAETGALAKFSINQVDKDGKLSPVKDKRLRRLFEVAPNAYYTWQELVEQTIQNFLLNGNAYLNFERLKDYELWSLEPYKMQVVPDKNEYVKGYLYDDTVAFDPQDIVHIRRGNAASMYYGTSAVFEVLGDALSLEGYAMQDLISFYENSSVGQGLLTSKFPLTPEQADSLRAQFQKLYGRDKSNRHGLLVVPNEMTYQSMKLNPKDSMLLDSLGISDDRVLRVFRMHKIVLGGNIESYANKIEDIVKMVFNTAIKPILVKIAAQLELHVRTHFKKDNIIVSINYDDVPYITTALEDKADAVGKLVGSGVMSYNEVRETVGLPTIANPNFDLNLMPSYLVGNMPRSVQNWQEGQALSPSNQQPAAPSTISPDGGAETETNDTRT